jgi:hypothetical protein
MPIPANQIIHAEILMKGIVTAQGSNSQKFEAVFCFRRTSVTNPPSKSQLETAFQTNIATPVLLALNNTLTQTLTSVRWINDALDVPVEFTETGVGGRSGDAMAKHNAAYILFRTGLRGKSYKGSKHFGPLSESDTTAGTADLFNAAALALWATANAAILAGFTDAGGNVWIPCVLSRKLSQLRFQPTTVVASDVTAVLINKRIGRMRRREVKSVY